MGDRALSLAPSVASGMGVRAPLLSSVRCGEGHVGKEDVSRASSTMWEGGGTARSMASPDIVISRGGSAASQLSNQEEAASLADPDLAAPLTTVSITVHPTFLILHL